jgi:hypothetical protein
MLWDGTVWANGRSGVTKNLYAIAGNSPNDLWAAGDNVILRYTGCKWTIAATPLVDVRAIHMLGDGGPVFGGSMENQTFAVIHLKADGGVSFDYEGGFSGTVLGIAGVGDTLLAVGTSSTGGTMHAALAEDGRWTDISATITGDRSGALLAATRWGSRLVAASGGPDLFVLTDAGLVVKLSLPLTYGISSMAAAPNGDLLLGSGFFAVHRLHLNGGTLDGGTRLEWDCPIQCYYDTRVLGLTPYWAVGEGGRRAKGPTTSSSTTWDYGTFNSPQIHRLGSVTFTTKDVNGMPQYQLVSVGNHQNGPGYVLYRIGAGTWSVGSMTRYPFAIQRVRNFGTNEFAFIDNKSNVYVRPERGSDPSLTSPTPYDQRTLTDVVWWPWTQELLAASPFGIHGIYPDAGISPGYLDSLVSIDSLVNVPQNSKSAEILVVSSDGSAYRVDTDGGTDLSKPLQRLSGTPDASVSGFPWKIAGSAARYVIAGGGLYVGPSAAAPDSPPMAVSQATGRWSGVSGDPSATWWAVGPRGALVRCAGASCTREETGTENDLNDVIVTPQGVFAVGANGTVLRRAP